MTPAELRARRKALGLTQAGLGEALGVAGNTVARWERAEARIGNSDLVMLALERLEAGGPDAARGRLRTPAPRPRRAPRRVGAARPQAQTAASLAPHLLQPDRRMPTQLTSFVGREREVAEVKHLVGATRLVTLTGAGGVGKTRLALRVADELADQFADGALFVPLAPITTPALVLSTIAQLLEVREDGGRPLPEMLRDVLLHQELLLVLDNFEQVLGAGPLVSGLLGSCPRLKVLVTSRAVLHVSGEHTYAVPPLAVPRGEVSPPLESLSQYEAVQLFIERARAARTEFAVTNETAPAVAEICARLDGLPLAIELAAARVRVLAPQAILGRLAHRLDLLVGGARDEPERHQTLRAAIAWSYDLLTPEEQAVFRRLAVFVGGCEVGAAEAVIGPVHESDGPDPAMVGLMQLLIALAEQGLVQASEAPAGETRFGLLETIREYALERLHASGDEAAVRRRHLAWCLALAEQAEPELWGPDQVLWMDRLETELDNIRAALEWSKQEPAETGSGLRLASALWRFWDVRGHLSDGQAQVEALRRSIPADDPSHTRGVYAAGYLAFRLGDLPGTRALAHTALALGQAVHDEWVVRWTLMGLGSISLAQGDLREAQALLDQSLELARGANDAILIRTALFWLGARWQAERSYTRAEACLEECLRLARAARDPWITAWALSGLGQLALVQGAHDRAAALQREALGFRVELRDQSAVAESLDALAMVAAVRGDYLRASRLYGSAQALRERVGASPWAPRRAERERGLAMVCTRLGEQAFGAALQQGRDLSAEEMVREALGVDGSAVAARIGQRGGAVTGPLTPREREVAALIAGGLSNSQIAANLSISQRTVERHVENILDKLSQVSRTQIAAWAVGTGLLSQSTSS